MLLCVWGHYVEKKYFLHDAFSFFWLFPSWFRSPRLAPLTLDPPLSLPVSLLHSYPFIPTQMCVFDQENFQGRCIEINGECMNVCDMGMDRVRSLRVDCGPWVVHTHTNTDASAYNVPSSHAAQSSEQVMSQLYLIMWHFTLHTRGIWLMFLSCWVQQQSELQGLTQRTTWRQTTQSSAMTALQCWKAKEIRRFRIHKGFKGGLTYPLSAIARLQYDFFKIYVVFKGFIYQCRCMNVTNRESKFCFTLSWSMVPTKSHQPCHQNIWDDREF